MQLTGGRLAALAIGLPVALVGAAFSAFNLAGLMAHGSEHHVASYAWHGGSISLHTGSGSIRVVAGSPDRIGVAYTEHYQLKKQKVTAATTADGGLELVSKCPAGIFDQNCDTDYVLTVPAAALLDLHTGSGGVHVSGVTGGATIRTGDGHVDLSDVSGALTLSTGSGGITGSGIGAAQLQAHTGDGGVSLDWSVVPTQASVTTGSGSVSLQLPAGSGPYRVDTSTGSGRRVVTVPTDPGAARSLTVHTGNGSITVAYAQP